MESNSIRSRSKSKMDLRISFVDLYVYLKKRTEAASAFQEAQSKMMKHLDKFRRMLHKMKKVDDPIMEKSESNEFKSQSSLEGKSDDILEDSEIRKTGEFNRDTEDALKIIEKYVTADQSRLFLRKKCDVFNFQINRP